MFIQTYQPMCRTDLFSVLCGLNPAAWLHTGTVGTLIDRFNFTVTGLASPPADGWFNQGTFETASGFKAVIANWIQGSLKITMYQPQCLARLTAGEGITVYPGLRQDRHNLPHQIQQQDQLSGRGSLSGHQFDSGVIGWHGTAEFVAGDYYHTWPVVFGFTSSYKYGPGGSFRRHGKLLRQPRSTWNGLMVAATQRRLQSDSYIADLRSED
jgi:hypothetical protein